MSCAAATAPAGRDHRAGAARQCSRENEGVREPAGILVLQLGIQHGEQSRLVDGHEIVAHVQMQREGRTGGVGRGLPHELLQPGHGFVHPLATTAGIGVVDEDRLPGPLEVIDQHVVHHPVAELRREHLAELGAADKKTDRTGGLVAARDEFLARLEQVQPGGFIRSRDDGAAHCEAGRASRAKPIAEPIGAKRGRGMTARRPPAPVEAGTRNRADSQFPAHPMAIGAQRTVGADLVKSPGRTPAAPRSAGRWPCCACCGGRPDTAERDSRARTAPRGIILRGARQRQSCRCSGCCCSDCRRSC